MCFPNELDLDTVNTIGTQQPRPVELTPDDHTALRRYQESRGYGVPSFALPMGVLEAEAQADSRNEAQATLDRAIADWEAQQHEVTMLAVRLVPNWPWL